MDAITITIDGREWPVNKPTDGQLLGLMMLAEGKFSEAQSGQLTLRTIMSLIPEEAHGDFVGEYLAGNYGPEHLRALIPAILEAHKSENGTAEITVTPAAAAAPVPRKRAAKKTVQKRPAARSR